MKSSRSLIRRITRWSGTLLVLYVGSYMVLSATGGWVVSESGEFRPFGMLAAGDIFQWQPRYGFCQRFRWSGGEYSLRADGIGYFYAPLILLDQRYAHPTIRFITPEGDVMEPIPAPPLSQYHPRIQNPFQGRFPYAPPPKD